MIKILHLVKNKNTSCRAYTKIVVKKADFGDTVFNTVEFHTSNIFFCMIVNGKQFNFNIIAT